MGKYYVYILKRPNGVPFYVGKGTRGRDKAHEWKAGRGAVGHLYNVIRKILATGGRVVIDRVIDGVTSEQACVVEKEWITKLGKKTHGGKLVNITDGGEGAPGYQHDLIARIKISESHRNRPPRSAESREKVAAAQRGHKMHPEAKEKLIRAITGKGHWNYGKKITTEHAEKLHASKRRPVLVDGEWFDSVRAAAVAHSITAPTAVYRINHGKNRGGKHGSWCYAA